MPPRRLNSDRDQCVVLQNVVGTLVDYAHTLLIDDSDKPPLRIGEILPVRQLGTLRELFEHGNAQITAEQDNIVWRIRLLFGFDTVEGFVDRRGLIVENLAEHLLQRLQAVDRRQRRMLWLVIAEGTQLASVNDAKPG